MGHGGGSSPRDLKQHTLRTFFLRAPYSDFAALAHGAKTEFRTPRRGVALPQLPTPVVLYAISNGGHTRRQLMVLVNHHDERLLDLSEDPAALAREGFRTYADFRAYWKVRNRRGWDPLAWVTVWRLAPFNGVVRDALADQLLRRLYGDYL